MSWSQLWMMNSTKLFKTRFRIPSDILRGLLMLVLGRVQNFDLTVVVLSLVGSSLSSHRSRSLQMHSQSQYCLLWKRLKGSSHSSWLHLLSSQVHLLKGQGQLHLCWSPGLGSLHKVSAKFIVFPGWCSVLNSYPWISWNILCRHGGVFSAVISTGLWLVNYHLSWRGAWKGNCKTGNARDHSY